MSGIVLVALTGMSASGAAWAAEGDLDPSFGGIGRVATPVGASAFVRAAAIDAQGRILVVGTAGASSAITAVRYLPNGGLDPGFSGDGVATFSASFGDGAAVAIDARGGILLVGTADVSGSPDYAMIRLNPDGSRDTSFGPSGSEGFVHTDVNTVDAGTAVAIDSQGRIVVGGHSRVGGDFDFSAVRYDANGLQDTGFGNGGEVTVDLSPFAQDQDQVAAIVIDTQDRIVLAGQTSFQDPSPGQDAAVVRLTAAGQRDPSFGSDPTFSGEVITPIGTSTDSLDAATLDAQGRIVVAGTVVRGGNVRNFALLRYGENGALDTSFSDDGKVVTPIYDNAGSGDQAHGVGIDSHGRVIAAGSATRSGQGDFAVVRYQPDGQLDTGFGRGGISTVANGDGLSAAFDAQERIIVAGLAPGPGGGDDQFAVARFIGDAIPPAATIVSGPADGALINDPTPTFEFASSEVGSTFDCGFDGLGSTCTSPFAAAIPLSDGKHTFGVTATDRAGNASAPTSQSFTVDTRPPEIDIDGKKKIKTHKKKARAKLDIDTSEPADLMCAVDKAQLAPCDDDYKTPKLKKGKHTVTVEATDKAGNSSDEAKKLKVVRKPRKP